MTFSKFNLIKNFFIVLLSLCSFNTLSLGQSSGDKIISTYIKDGKIDTLKRGFLPKEFEAYSRKQRDKIEKPEEVVNYLGIEPGIKIGEAGAGQGYLTFHLSQKVGDNGLIYANDISEFELSALTHYAKEFGIRENINTVLGKIEDPMFPVHDLDMIVIYKSFHDFEKKTEWLTNVRKYLKKEGRIAIIESFNDHTKTNRRRLNKLMTNSKFKLQYHKKLFKHIFVYVMES